MHTSSKRLLAVEREYDEREIGIYLRNDQEQSLGICH